MKQVSLGSETKISAFQLLPGYYFAISVHCKKVPSFDDIAKIVAVALGRKSIQIYVMFLSLET